MPNWKKIALSGSSPEFNSVSIDNAVTASIFTGSLLRLDENGTGLRMTNVGAFDNSTGDFRIFANQDLILSTNGDTGTAVTFDQTTKDANFVGAITASSFTGTFNGALSSSAQIASDISGAFASDSSSLSTRLTSQESFSSSIESTIYSYTGSFSGDGSGLTGVTADGTLSSSAQIASDISGAFDPTTVRTYTGSFVGDGSGLTGVETELTEQVTLVDTFTNATTQSISHTFATKNLNVTVYDDNDDIFIPTRINTPNTSSVVIYMDPATSGRAVISKGGHIVSGSIATNIVETATVSDTFTSANTHSVSHAFETKDVIVTVYDDNDDMFIPSRISTPTTSSVVIYMDPVTTGRVVVAKGGHIVSGSVDVDFSSVGEHIIPATADTYDLGSAAKPWRDLYLSDASLYIDGQQVISSTTDTLTFTTDTGQSIKLLETGADDIILQTDTGNIELKGTVEILSGKKITDSAGTVIQFGDTIGVTGSIETTGTVDGIDLQAFSGSVAASIANSTADYTQLTNVPSGIISGAAQLPSGTVSGSSQITITESQISDLSHYANSDVLTYINSLGVVSGSVASDWDSISSKPAGIVSSSAQITALTSYTETFTSQTAVTASHSLGTKDVTVSVYGSDDYMIFPTSIKTHDDNNVYVQFNSSRTGRIVITK